MLIIIAGIVLFIVAVAMPTHVQVVLLVINLVLPDPFPFVDEIIEIAALVTSIAIKSES